MEQPTRYFLSINIKTAKALGLAIPQSLAVRADEVKNHMYDLRTAKLRLEPFAPVLKDPSMFAISRKVDAQIDKDFFLALLNELWGITFKDLRRGCGDDGRR